MSMTKPSTPKPNARTAYNAFLTELWISLFFSTMTAPKKKDIQSTLGAVLITGGRLIDLSSWDAFSDELRRYTQLVSKERDPIDLDLGDDQFVTFGSTYRDFSESLIQCILELPNLEESPYPFMAPDDVAGVVPLRWSTFAVDMGSTQASCLVVVDAVEQWNQMLLANHYTQ